jgi:TonB-linked SusC/RagA family outer membrane protein
MKLRLALICSILIACASVSWAQVRIQGTVKDSKTKAGLPGVGVKVENTTIGTATDVNGNYTLDIGTGNVNLVFSFIGYTPKTVSAAGKTKLDVELAEDVKNLGQVVVTALGITKDQRSLGYATQTVGGKDVVGSGETNMIQGLAGKASGVQVIGSGGTPGASSKIMIRGPHSFQGNGEPLIVIDGVPIDNSTQDANLASDNPFNGNLDGVNQSNRGIDIDPNDIESVNILKGPAATALYGVRGGNGALVITTKRGTKGNIRATYSTSIEFNQVNKLPKRQTTYGQGFGGGQLDSLGNPIAEGDYDTYDPASSAGTPNSWGPRISNIPGGKVYDNQKDFFRTGVSFNNNLSVSGGSENASVRLSLGQTRQNGVIPNTNFNRYSVRLSGDAKLSEKIDVSATINYVRSGGTRAQNGSNLSGVMLGLLRSPASFNMHGDGADGYMNADGTQRQYYAFYDNPYWSVYQNPYKDQVDRVNGNFFMKYKPAKWFFASYRIGTDAYTDQGTQQFALGSWAPPNSPNGQLELSTSRYQNVYGDLLLNFEGNIKEKWFGTLRLGNNFWYTKTSSAYERGRDFVLPNFYNMSNATNYYAANGASETRSTALFFDMELEYNKIVYLNVTGRNEWHSTFLPGKASFFFPSVNGSFVFSELLKETKGFSFGKLRVGYAVAGVPPLGAYNTRTYLSQPLLTDGYTNGNSFPFLGVNGFGYSSLGQLGNGKLKPEVNRNVEFGADLRFLDNTIRLDVNYFNQKSKNMLLTVQLPSTSGMKYTYVNAASMVNQGVEITLGVDVFKRENFKWTIDLNGTYFRNEVKTLYKDIEQFDIESGFEDANAYAIIGQPMGVFYGTKWQRDASGNLVIGADGLPIVDSKRGVIGNPWPKFYGGLRNSFTVKNFTFGFLWDYRIGGDIWCGTIARMNRIGVTEGTVDRDQTYLIKGVKEDGTANDISISAWDYWRAYKGDAAGISAAENAIYDGSWLRLRELSFGYTFRVSNVKSPVKSVGLNFTCRNLILITKYPGVDPETSLTGSGSLINGYDYFNNPGTRSYILGVNVNF